MYNYIAISGTIGAGKSELANRIASQLNGTLILEEFASNSFLEKFYKSPERYAFPLEISFLFERFQQLNTLFSKADLFTDLFVSDYLFDKSLLFAKNNLTEDQFSVFLPLFQAFKEQVPFPDLTIYLHRPVEVLLANIRKRGRSFEQEIEFDYLNDLQNRYLTYFKSMSDKRILILELNDLDFIEDEKMFSQILDLTGQSFNFGTHLIRF